jgi:hypothetical protein
VSLDTKEVVDDILAHHGVKGMRWGVRRSLADRRAAADAASAARKKPTAVTVTRSTGGSREKIKTKGGERQPAHPDAIIAKVATQKVRKSGLQSLSNEELQALATRLDLEQRVSRLHNSQPAETGKEHVVKFLKDPKNQQKIQQVAQKQGPKLAAKIIAKKAAKVAAVAAVA